MNPTVNFSYIKPDVVSLVVHAFDNGWGISKSRGDARRLVEQGSVYFNQFLIDDPKAEPILVPGWVLKLDKRHSVIIGT